jgi:prevent-host-death family protein
MSLNAVEISVTELRDRLSTYLCRVQQGAEFVVTRHGRPIARLVPIDLPVLTRSSMTARELRQLPWVSSARTMEPIGSRDPLPYRSGEKTVAEIVLEDRS